MSRRALVPIVCAAAAVAALGWTALRGPARPASLQERVRAVASTLRCPVCEDLTVADSPSAVARQMRRTIARELRAGVDPDAIRARFVDAYGESISLEPSHRGLDLVAWLVPVALVIGGLGGVAVAVRRWTGPPTAAGVLPEDAMPAPERQGTP